MSVRPLRPAGGPLPRSAAGLLPLSAFLAAAAPAAPAPLAPPSKATRWRPMPAHLRRNLS